MDSAAEKRFKRTASKLVKLKHKKRMRATLPEDWWAGKKSKQQERFLIPAAARIGNMIQSSAG